MKYCPYCGAALPDSAVSFCPECGKSLPDTEVKTPVREKKRKEKPVKSKVRSSKAKKTDVTVEDDYDGYYNDRLPIDEGRRQDGPDRNIIKKIVALVLCLLVVIGACVAILYVL
ncbi:MAG: zinc ribbon domain-containing protein [Acutalibacter muris]|nr:zinc ribbon domain-containing protein [Acutalibacter muris]